MKHLLKFTLASTFCLGFTFAAFAQSNTEGLQEHAAQGYVEYVPVEQAEDNAPVATPQSNTQATKRIQSQSAPVFVPKVNVAPEHSNEVAENSTESKKLMKDSLSKKDTARAGGYLRIGIILSIIGLILMVIGRELGIIGVILLIVGLVLILLEVI